LNSFPPLFEQKISHGLLGGRSLLPPSNAGRLGSPHLPPDVLEGVQELDMPVDHDVSSDGVFDRGVKIVPQFPRVGPILPIVRSPIARSGP